MSVQPSLLKSNQQALLPPASPNFSLSSVKVTAVSVEGMKTSKLKRIDLIFILEECWFPLVVIILAILKGQEKLYMD